MTSRGSDAETSRRGVIAAAAALPLAACAVVAPPTGAEPDAVETVRVGEHAVGFRRFGAAGPAVVLIHGASANHRDWALAAAPAIAASGRTVIAFDRPGHGASDWPGPAGVRLCEQARLMAGALARLGVRRATLAGHSYGGSVALSWALEQPDLASGLLLVAAPSQVWTGGLGLSTDLLASPVSGPALARILPAVLPRAAAEAAAARAFAPQSPPQGYLEAARVDLVLRPATLRANALQLAALKDQVRVMAPRYGELAVPVELLHGTADVTVPLAIHSGPFAAQVARARLTTLEGVGHMPHHAAPAAVLAALDRLPER